MWDSEEIDDCIGDLCNIAFSEDFSFCFSSPDYYKKRKIHKPLVSSKSSPSIGDSLDIKRMRKSFPIVNNDKNQYSVNSSTFLYPYKALIHATNSLETQVRNLDSPWFIFKGQIYTGFNVHIINFSLSHKVIIQ